ncbi:MAG TPA: hypothetical protein PLK94_14315, partial [Alphaproteobacteria bacterium]|nr:hypothetical protein [Alphaproteobacteria bacterium]
GQASSFVAQMSSYSGLSPNVVVSLVQQQNGQGLAVIARGCGISKQDFSNMFVLVRRVFDKTETVSPEHALKAHEYFDKITVEIARKILSRSQH